MIKPRFESTDLLDADKLTEIPKVLRNSTNYFRSYSSSFEDAQHPKFSEALEGTLKILEDAAEQIEKRLEALK